MHEKMPPSGEEEGELATTVLTCEGDLRDPAFPSRLKSLVCRLQRLISDDEHPLCVQKVEPWNSVRVTFSIPREAAARLRQLAQQGDDVLRQLGILSVQIQGDQVITLTLAGRYGESQEIVLRKSPEPGEQAASQAPLAVQASTSAAGEPPRPGRRPSSESSVGVALAAGGSCALESLPGPSNMEATRKNIVQYLSQQGTCSAAAAPAARVPQRRRPSASSLGSNASGGDVGFRSPNVVAPASSDLPFSAARTNKNNLGANFGPFPFASMQHAMNTKHSSHLPSAAASIPPASTSAPVPTPSAPSASTTPPSTVMGRTVPYVSAFTASAASLLSSASSATTGLTFPRTCSSTLNNLHPSSRTVGSGTRANIALSSPLLVNLLQSDAAAAAAAGSSKMLPPPAPDDGPMPKRKRKPRKPRVDKTLDEEVHTPPLAFAAPASPHLTAATTTQHNTATYTTGMITSGSSNPSPSAFVKTSSAGYDLQKVVHSQNAISHHPSPRCNPHASHTQPVVDSLLAPVGAPPVARPLPYSAQHAYPALRLLHASSLSSREGIKTHTSPPVAAKPIPEMTLSHTMATISAATTDGKTKHLINPFTGHLEPMPSDEEDESVDSLPMFPEGELDTSENGGQSERSLSDGGKDNPSSDTDSGISKSHTDISQSSTDLPPESTVTTTNTTEEAKSIETTTKSVISQQRELKLRLKIKECDSKEKRLKTEVNALATAVGPASGRLDVSFVSIPGVRKNSVLLPPEPKVPPLHISLRGPNAAVVVSPRKEDRLRDLEHYHNYGTTQNSLEQKKCRPSGGRGVARSLSNELGFSKGAAGGNRGSSHREHRRGSKNGCQLERTREQKLLSGGSILLQQVSEGQPAVHSPPRMTTRSPQEVGSDPSSSSGVTDTMDSSPESSKSVLHVIKDEVLPMSQADFKLNTYEVRNCRARALSLDSLKGLKGPGGRLTSPLHKREPDSALTVGPTVSKREPFRQEGIQSIVSRTDPMDLCQDITNKSVLVAPEPAVLCNHLPHSTPEQDYLSGATSIPKALQQHQLQQEKGRVPFGAAARRHSAKADLAAATDGYNSHHPAVTENHVLPFKDWDEGGRNADKHSKVCNSHAANNNNITMCSQGEGNCTNKVEMTPRNSLENHCRSDTTEDCGFLAKPVYNNDQHGIDYTNQSATTNCNLYETYTNKVGNRKAKTDAVMNHQDVFDRLSNERLRNSSDTPNSSPSSSPPDSLCLVNLNHSSSPVAKIISVDSLPGLKQVIQVPSVRLAAATTCGSVPKPSLVKSDVKIDNCMIPSLIPSVGDVYCERLSSGHDDHFVRVGGGGSPMVHHTKLVAIGDSRNLHALKFATSGTGGGAASGGKVSDGSKGGLCGGLASSAIKGSSVGGKPAPAQDKITENGNALSSEESSLDSELSERDSPPTGTDKAAENSNPSGTSTQHCSTGGRQQVVPVSTVTASEACSVVVYEEEEDSSGCETRVTQDSLRPLPTPASTDQSQNSDKTGGTELETKASDCQVSSPKTEKGLSETIQDNSLVADSNVNGSTVDTNHRKVSTDSVEDMSTMDSIIQSDPSSGIPEVEPTIDNFVLELESSGNDSTLESEPEQLQSKKTEKGDCQSTAETKCKDPTSTSMTTPEQDTTVSSGQADSVAAVTMQKEDETADSAYATCSLPQSSSHERTVQSPGKASASLAHSGGPPPHAQTAPSATAPISTASNSDSEPSSLVVPPTSSSATSHPPATGLNLLPSNRGSFGGSETSKVTLIFKSASGGSHHLASSSASSGSPSTLVKPKSVPIKLVALPSSCGNLGRSSSSTVFEIIGQSSPGSHSNSGSPGPGTGSPVRLLVKTTSPQTTSPRTTMVVKSVVVTGASHSLKLLPTTVSSVATSGALTPLEPASCGATTSCNIMDSDSVSRNPTTDSKNELSAVCVTQTEAETPLATESQNMQQVQHQSMAVCMDLPVIGAAETTQTGDPQLPALEASQDFTQNMQASDGRTGAMQCDLSSPQRTGSDGGGGVVLVSGNPSEEKLEMEAERNDEQEPVRPSSPSEPLSSEHRLDLSLVYSKPPKRKCTEQASEVAKACWVDKRHNTRSSSQLLLGSQSSEGDSATPDLAPKATLKVETEQFELEVKSEVKTEEETELLPAEAKVEMKEETGRSTRTSSSSSRSSSRAEDAPSCVKAFVEASETASECSSEDELSLSELANKSRGLSGPLVLALSAERPLTTSPCTRHSRSLLKQQQQHSSAPQSEESEVEYLYTTPVPSGCRSSSNESRSSSSRCGAGEQGGGGGSGRRTRSSKRVRTESSSSSAPTAAAPTTRHQRQSKRTTGRERPGSCAVSGKEAPESRSSLVTSTTTTTAAAAAAAVLASTVAGVLMKEEAANQTTKRKTRSGSVSTEQPDSTTSSSSVKRRRVSKDCHR